ncbi:hypothetical protein Tco_0429579 [Tanacetum coccineum]
MSTSTHPIIVLSNFNVEDAFSSTNTPDYTPASPDYSPASPRNTSSNPSEDLSKDRLASLAILPFYNDPYIKDGSQEDINFCTAPTIDSSGHQDTSCDSVVKLWKHTACLPWQILINTNRTAKVKFATGTLPKKIYPGGIHSHPLLE